MTGPPVLSSSRPSGALVVGPTVHAAAAAPSPASGHAEVIAQGLVTFADGPAHWTLTVDAVTETVSTIPSAAPAFLLSDGPAAVVVADPTGPLARLAPGEAMFRSGGAPTDLSTAPASTGQISEIAVVAGSGPDEFTPGAGIRDVDLVRDVVATNEALILNAEVSAFVVVSQGAVVAGATTITAGSAVALTGSITLINTAAEPAIVAVAVIGPIAGLERADPDHHHRHRARRAAPAAPAPTPTAAPNPPTTPPTTSDEHVDQHDEHDHHDDGSRGRHRQRRPDRHAGGVARHRSQQRRLRRRRHPGRPGGQRPRQQSARHRHRQRRPDRWPRGRPQLRSQRARHRR